MQLPSKTPVIASQSWRPELSVRRGR